MSTSAAAAFMRGLNWFRGTSNPTASPNDVQTSVTTGPPPLIDHSDDDMPEMLYFAYLEQGSAPAVNPTLNVAQTTEVAQIASPETQTSSNHCAISGDNELNHLTISSAKPTLAPAKPASPRRLKVDEVTWRKLNLVLQRHHSVTQAAITKMVNVKNDFSEDNVRSAFENAHKDQLISMLEYGIDIFSPFCARRKEGEEKWVIDFYGRNNKSFTRDLIEEQKLAIMKEYRRQKWKISLVGGSVTRWNGRRQFIAFLERYVMNPKFEDLKESTRRVFSIATVQSAVISYM